MESKAIFGILSAIFTLFGAIFYLRSIYRKEINPHILSWIGWAFITMIGATAMLDSGSTWSVLFVISNSLSCISVALYSIYKRVGTWSTTIYDYVFFGFGILGIILWQTFDAPLLAIVLSVLADLFFAVPTLVKVYKNPKSENAKSWIPYCIAGIFGLLSMKTFSSTEVLYPIYIFTLNFMVLGIVLFKDRKISNAKIS